MICPTRVAGFLLSRIVNQDLAHRSGTDGKKVCPTAPVNVRAVDQLDEGFVNDCRRIECVIWLAAA
jgi:hypothetical protein